MTEDERLHHLLRRALPAVTAQRPSRDLWPAVAEHMGTRPAWSRFDISLAVAVAISLVLFPEALWFIAYHL
jgi:hypothetical protein